MLTSCYRVLSNSKTDDRRYGQTCEAFAVCVAKMFQAFERRMSSIEVDYCQTQGITSHALFNWVPVDANRDVLQVANRSFPY